MYCSIVKTKGCHILPLDKIGSACHLLPCFCENDFMKMTKTQLKHVTVVCSVQHKSFQISHNVNLNSLILVEDIVLCLKYNNKNKIYMYSIKHNKVYIALVATSFSRYDHHQTNAIRNLKRLVT